MSLDCVYLPVSTSVRQNHKNTDDASSFAVLFDFGIIQDDLRILCLLGWTFAARYLVDYANTMLLLDTGCSINIITV